jgi:hypothetical protein
MSEAYSDPPDSPEPEDGEEPELEPQVEEPEEEDEPAAARKKAEDWEKRAHNHAGQAARERSRRQAAERKASDLESRLERLERGRGGGDEDELLATIAGLREDNDDPIGDIDAVKRALKLFRQRQVAESQETTAQQAVERQVEGLRSAMAEAESDFAIDHPDYHQAAVFYRKARTDELTDAGYAGQYLQRKLADDLFGVVRMAMEAGFDPAERVYALAKKRGFRTGTKAAGDKLDAIQRSADTGVRPTARASPGVQSWGDVAKLDGAARDKAWAKLAQRERASQKGH